MVDDDTDFTRFTRRERADDEQRALDELRALFEHVHVWQLADMETGGPLIQPKSSLAGDDRLSAPFQVSIATQQAVGVAVDHLHSLRAAVIGAGSLHMAAPFTLLRAAFETSATALFVLGAPSRADRVARALELARDDTSQLRRAVLLLAN